MIHLRLFLFGAALVGGIGLAVYNYYKSQEQQQHHSYGNRRRRSFNGSSQPEPSTSNIRQRTAKPRVKRKLEVCSICLSNVKTDGRILDCGHEFHKRCINVSLNTNKFCPNCNAPVQETCSICLEVVTEGMFLTCGHEFHVPCIDAWLNQNCKRLCPVCRAPV